MIGVFPTPVGMNRTAVFMLIVFISVPHTRGDEPVLLLVLISILVVFPTPVGMNRQNI